MLVSIDVEKASDKNQKPIHNKTQQTRYRAEPPWICRENTIRKQVKAFAFTTLIQHSAKSSSQHNMAERKEGIQI